MASAPIAQNNYQSQFEFMKTKIQILLKALNQGLVEREYTLKTALLTVLAGENLVLIGPPGTGKSLIARRMADCLNNEGKGSNYFEYLLTKFSTPEEIFGPLSISELKADRFRRNTDGYLPTVKIAFLDEIFKASSSILNALLTVLNERIYHNGSEPQKVPLIALIAASNELPTNQVELNALYDRFMVRIFVDYVKDENLPLLFEPMEELQIDAATRLSASEFDLIRQAAEKIEIPPEIGQAIQRIWITHKETFKEDRRESLSDRRLKKALKLMRVSAATNGRQEMDLSDVFLLKDFLWNHQDNAAKVQGLILHVLQECSQVIPDSEALQLVAPTSKEIVYELEKDGQTLTPANDNIIDFAAITNQQFIASPTSQKIVIRGFQGSGTAQDPLLIQTVHDLVDLERDEVGLQGYYFRQTADLDLSEFSTWPKINLKGHYDGNQHAIKDQRVRNIFSSIFESTVHDLILLNCSLANTAHNQTNIFNCQTNSHLIDSADNCIIAGCEADSFLINATIDNSIIINCKSGNSISRNQVCNSKIDNCHSGGPLVFGEVQNSSIRNCLVVLIKRFDAADILLGGIRTFSCTPPKSFGGISTVLHHTEVDRCFVTGALNGHAKFSGIASLAKESSAIRYCALGDLSPKEISGKLMGRIVNQVDMSSILEKNVSIDTINSGGALNEGESIASVRFNQRYFEHTLGWDFQNTWYWDEQQDRPALRSVGVGSVPAPSQAAKADSTSPMVDILAQQLRANIWL